MSEASPSPKPLDLAALGVYDSDAVEADGFARVLLLGAAKIGKTTAILRDAPKPLVINCDGRDALTGAVNQGAKGFHAIDASTPKQWAAAVKAAEAMVKAGLTRTIIVDSLSLLADNLLDFVKATGLDGFEKWNEYDYLLRSGVKKLLTFEAHIFLIAHIAPSEEDGLAGSLPLIPGQAKLKIPAAVSDWVVMTCDPAAKPERQFLLGPQKSWNHSGRNIRRTTAIPASCLALLEEFGIAP